MLSNELRLSPRFLASAACSVKLCQFAQRAVPQEQRNLKIVCCPDRTPSRLKSA
jgi:hypothetical protein